MDRERETDTSSIYCHRLQCGRHGEFCRCSIWTCENQVRFHWSWYWMVKRIMIQVTRQIQYLCGTTRCRPASGKGWRFPWVISGNGSHFLEVSQSTLPGVLHNLPTIISCFKACLVEWRLLWVGSPDYIPLLILWSRSTYYVRTWTDLSIKWGRCFRRQRYVLSATLFEGDYDLIYESVSSSL